MRVLIVPAGGRVPEAALGAIASRTVPGPARGTAALLRKGETLTRDHLARLPEAAPVELHLLVPGTEDVPQDVAAGRLARAVAGRGVRAEPATHGQATLRATQRGWLTVRREQLRRVNRHQGVLVFTAPGDRVVEAGARVAAAKAARLLLPDAPIRAVEEDSERHGPVVEVLPFRPSRVALVMTSRLRSPVRERARVHLASKLARFGATLAPVVEVQAERSAIAEALECLPGDPAVILVAGGVSTDPAAPVFLGLQAAGGELVQVGLPVDPGTACWVGRLGSTPIVGLATCELSGRFTAVDLLLPRLLVGQPLGAELLGDLAEGGLLDQRTDRPV